VHTLETTLVATLWGFVSGLGLFLQDQARYKLDTIFNIFCSDLKDISALLRHS